MVIEEVIVTVSKREEPLQDVTGSVSAFDGEALQWKNVQDLASLVELVPGMDEVKIAIRGISRTERLLWPTFKGVVSEQGVCIVRKNYTGDSLKKNRDLTS